MGQVKGSRWQEAAITCTTPSIFFSWKCLANVGMMPPKLVLQACWVERLSPSRAPSSDTTWESSSFNSQRKLRDLGSFQKKKMQL